MILRYAEGLLFTAGLLCFGLLPPWVDKNADSVLSPDTEDEKARHRKPVVWVFRIELYSYEIQADNLFEKASGRYPNAC
jgi:hypothetical protein